MNDLAHFCNNNIVSDNNLFARITKERDVVADANLRLPSKLIAAKFVNVSVFEFHQAVRHDFWDFLILLAQQNSSDAIVTMVVEPDPRLYFYKHYNHFATLLLTVAESTDRYSDLMSASPHGIDADSMIIRSDVITWFDTNRSWIIWAERQIGVAVLASVLPLSAIVSKSSPSTMKNVEDADYRYAAANFQTDNDFEEYKSLMLRSFT